MRKELKEVFNGFLGVEKQKSIKFESQETSILSYDFNKMVLNTNAERINTIEVSHEITAGNYCSFLIEEYSFSFFRIKKEWYCLVWIYSFYKNKEVLFEYMKERITSSNLLKGLEFGDFKSYGESNFMPIKFSSFNSKLMNDIDIEKEKFNYLLNRDYKKNNCKNLSLNEKFDLLYDLIGEWYIGRPYTERREIINLLEVNKDGFITKNSIELVELNYTY